MFKLRLGYLTSGLAIGLVILFGFLGTLPDGTLRLVFCDVGQGDSIYVRFADGRDMLVDGGPNNKVLECLGEHMPFWDRSIDIVVLTHPQKDHLQGLIEVVKRYDVGYFVKSDVGNVSEGYKALLAAISQRHAKVKTVTAGERILVGGSALTVLWPTASQIASMRPVPLQGETLQGGVLGAQTTGNLNDASIVLWLRYGVFDAILTGDADTRVEAGYRGQALAVDRVEVLKVPHHGSKTGMTKEYLDWLHPQFAVISVGKNSYGHPSEKILGLLKDKGIQTQRTDMEGDIEVVSDGKGWRVGR